MMFGLLDYAKMGAGVVVGAVLMAVPAYVYGHIEGKKAASVSALETTVHVLVRRGAINGEISVSDADSLCTYLGLSDDDKNECMRRVREADANTTN